MQPQQALESQQTSQSDPVFVESKKLFGQMEESAQSIDKRAYELTRIWRGASPQDRARTPGHVFRRTRSLPLELKESDEQLIVRAEVPGFKPDEIKVSVEPNQIVISGQIEQKKEEEMANEDFSEFRSNQICRCLSLPTEVDPAKTTATLKDGVLELTLAKAAASKATNVEVKAA